MNKKSNIENFIIFNYPQIKSILSESSTISDIGGGNFKEDTLKMFYADMRHYKKEMDEMAIKYGWTILTYFIPMDTKLEKFFTKYPDGPIDGSTVDFNLIKATNSMEDPTKFPNYKAIKKSNLKVLDKHIEDIADDSGMEEVNPDAPLNESSTINAIGSRNITDDGLKFFYDTIMNYKKQSENEAKRINMSVSNYLVPDVELEKYDTNYPNGPIDGSTIDYNLIKATNSMSDPTKFPNYHEIEKDAHKIWKQHIDRMVNNLGWEYLNTKNEDVLDEINHDFINEIFNVIESKSFFITYKNDKVKIARNKNELKQPYNIISILTEDTNTIFISQLIDINNKVLSLKHKDELFENGNIFFEFKENNIGEHRLTRIIDTDNNMINKDKLKTINKLF